MEMEKIPVLLLTGYLGSGKTTLLNRILNNRSGIKFAVIVNDIGEVNIDADLIEKGGIVGQKDDSLVALQNGCICCTLKMDLVEQLRDITRQHRFDYIVIEASGICEPAPIAQTICSMPSMGLEYVYDGEPVVDCIVSVVDALRMRDEFGSGDLLMRHDIEEEDIENLVIQQIEFCNIILLNKASEVKPEELERVRQIVRALQPKAEIIETDYCDVPFEKILHTGMFDFDQVATSAAWINEIENHHEDDDDDDDDDEHEHHHHHDDDDDDEHEHHHHPSPSGESEGGSHHHHHHHHDEGEAEEYGIGTYVYYRRPALNLGLFDEFVARRWPKGVIRAKGICWFHDEPDMCYVFEQAGKQVSIRQAGQWYATMPENELRLFKEQNPGLQRDWDDRYGDRMQKLVFIGQHLDKEAIARELDRCLEE
ncbi:MAG: GTP-binding protein [Prevotella sp.]|nr:GTP-binding protein [Prevotella sp.]MBP3211648.1 GTP-binding protein [Prevotella sp.]